MRLRRTRVRPSTGGDAALQENHMQLEQRIQDDIVIVKVTGDITLNQGGDVQVKDKVQSLLQQGQKKIVLDLGEVAYVDSAGLGQLVQAYATTKNQGGSLKLMNLGKKLRDLLVVTKLVTVFDTYETEAEALQSFVA
jgi:anti-sigma B factor antagonist